MRLISIYIIIALLFGGCGVGSIVATPFKVTGAVVNIVTPKAVGESISKVGEISEDMIPF